jgi:uncharacterized protein (DUF362 family)
MKVEDLLSQNRLGRLLNTAVSRKGFLRSAGLAALLALAPSRKKLYALVKSGDQLAPRPAKKIATLCDLAVATGESPAAITRKAVDTLGGIRRFVKPGAVVVVKPNIGWDRTPEQAANTTPAVVAELVKMSFEAGAKTVKVFDLPCNDARRTYQNSGIYDAVKKAGGLIYHLSDWKFVPARFPAGSLLSDWPLFRDAVECDCLINVPIAKHHSLAKLTLSMKNLMGLCGEPRGDIHTDIDRKLVELTGFFKPELTVIDAYRVLLRHGPSGGDLNDVARKNTVIASADPVLADAYAATLFSLAPEQLGYVRLGAQAGLGSLNISAAKIQKVSA